MKQKTKRTIKRILIVLAIALLGGLVGSFAATGSSFFDRDPNPDNLILVDNYVIKDGEDPGDGVEATVKDDGTIKLNGKAKANTEFTVAELVLEPGEYTISGYDSEKSTKGIKVVFGVNEHYAGTSSDTFILETSTTVRVVIYVTEDTYCLNSTFRPVLVTGDDPGDFYK